MTSFNPQFAAADFSQSAHFNFVLTVIQDVVGQYYVLSPEVRIMDAVDTDYHLVTRFGSC